MSPHEDRGSLQLFSFTNATRPWWPEASTPGLNCLRSILGELRLQLSESMCSWTKAGRLTDSPARGGHATWRLWQPRDSVGGRGAQVKATCHLEEGSSLKPDKAHHHGTGRLHASSPWWLLMEVQDSKRNHWRPRLGLRWVSARERTACSSWKELLSSTVTMTCFGRQVPDPRNSWCHQNTGS